MKRTLLVFVLVLCAAAASAGTITSINPSSIKVNSGEWFVTIYGSGLGNVVVFDGPAGHHEVNSSAVFNGEVHFWVPSAVAAKSGTHNVYVRGGTGDSNVVPFVVQGFKFFPYVIIIPDVIRYQPINREGGYPKFDIITAGGEVYDPSPRIDCFPQSGSFFKMGATRVQCSATNSIGEKATAEFDLVMADSIGPDIKVPREPIVVKADSKEGTRVQYDVTAYDDIWGDATAECFPRSGDNFPIGVNTVQCTATDFDGNVGAASFIVEVTSDEPFYKLIVNVPPRVVVDARSPEGEFVDYKVDVKGTKDPSPEVTCYPKAGTLFPIGMTTINCAAIDMYGMRGSAEFYVEVRDPNDPKFDKLYASPALLPADGRLYPIEITAVAFDEIDPRPVCSIYAVTSNQSINLGEFDDPKNYDWLVTGDLKLEVRAEMTRTDRYYDVWVGCSDFYGNRVNSTARIWVTANGGQSVQEPSSGGSKRRSGPKP